MSKNKLNTVGQLRDFLAMMLVGLKDGTIDADTANKAVKIASAINENFYAEIKVQKTRFELADEKITRLGDMQLGAASDE